MQNRKKCFVFAAAYFFFGTINAMARAFGSYNHQVSDILSASVEIKWLNATETENAAFSAQVLLAWKFLDW